MQGKEFVAIKLFDVVIVACYISPRYKIEVFEDVLDRMENELELLERENNNIIICGDFNLHAVLWGSRFNSIKERRLEGWMESKEMTLMNVGDTPTCVRPQGESIVDLTWTTSGMVNRIKEWKVEIEKISLSDHYYVTFIVDDNRGRKIGNIKRKGNKSLKWRIKEMDLDLFGEVLEWRCDAYQREKEIMEEDKGAEWLQRVMTEAADASTPRAKGKITSGRKQVHWWNEDIEQSRKQCINSRRKWLRAKRKEKKKKNGSSSTKDAEMEVNKMERDYRGKKKELVKKILEAKEESWKTLLQDINRDPWGIPYKLVMNKLRRSEIGMSESLEGKVLDQLIYKLFPRETEEEQKEGEIIVGEWKDEWDVNVAEVHKVIRKEMARKNTAPGPDGIARKMWRNVPECMLKIIAEILTVYMRKGEFLERWKRAGLVLIPKEAKKNQEQGLPKARSICLINDIGKSFERIIADRINKWKESKEGIISRNQFGFKKGRSTIDALFKVKDKIERATQEGKIVIAVSLDVENAFNSIS